MKVFKQNAARFLVMIMVLAFLPVQAFASEMLVLQGSVHENVKIGDTVTVAFSANDVPACGGDLQLEFDNTVLALVSIKPNDEFAVKKIGFAANVSNGYMSIADDEEWVISEPWFTAEFTVLDGAVAGAEYEITISGYVYDWNLNDIPLNINACCIKLQEAAPHMHDYMETVTKPTCTEQGYTTYLCECGDTYIGNETEALGHTEVTDKAVEATCTEPGKTEGKHCSVCGTVIVVQTETAAKGHNEVTDESIAATCTEPGKTEGKHCDRCGEIIVAQTEVPAKGHSFGDWYVTKEATTEAEGQERRDCAACDHFETRAIPKVEIPTEGQCGGSLTWSYDKTTGTLTITGSGAMWNFTISLKQKSADPMVPWAAYQSEIKAVVLSEGITAIGNNAFAGCENLTEVTLPKTVTAIGEGAFLDSGLKEITFQGDAPEVSESAFQGVSATITYPQDNETWTEDKMQDFGGALTWAPETGHEYKLGDVNHDGKINAKDATLILQKSVGVLKETAKFCEDCAEVSGDGKLNAKDSTLILQFSVGLRGSFPAQK